MDCLRRPDWATLVLKFGIGSLASAAAASDALSPRPLPDHRSAARPVRARLMRSLDRSNGSPSSL